MLPRTGILLTLVSILSCVKAVKTFSLTLESLSTFWENKGCKLKEPELANAGTSIRIMLGIPAHDMSMGLRNAVAGMSRM